MTSWSYAFSRMRIFCPAMSFPEILLFVSAVGWLPVSATAQSTLWLTRRSDPRGRVCRAKRTQTSYNDLRRRDGVRSPALPGAGQGLESGQSDD